MPNQVCSLILCKFQARWQQLEGKILPFQALFLQNNLHSKLGSSKEQLLKWLTLENCDQNVHKK
jgi:hypothetical protein